ASRATIAIENARLFRQTQAQLRELSALQKTITTLQSSLELQEVLDRIAQAVVTGLGYHIALLAEYEKETNALTTRAVAADPSLVGAVEAISGMKAMGVSITLDQTENLGVRAALAREIAVTQCPDDLFRPVVSAEISEAIQELAGVKSMVTIPFFTKGRLVGNMFAGTDKEAITEAEIDSLESSLVRRPSPSRTPGFSKRRPGSEKRPKPCARRPWP
ncbi:MAG: GAF domain-containing protein, partial [Anaerolineales bacterium]|nr:GAF domain-containing protein [Anaerolineales bacterium]